MARNVLAKGWRYHANGGLLKNLLKMEEFQITQPGTLLSMQAASVNHVDFDQIRGYYGPVRLPAVAGNSGVGNVIEGGGNLKEGDRVVVAACQGAWADKAVAGSGSFVAKLPDAMPYESASTLAEGPMAAYQILKSSGLKSGDVLALDGEDTLLGSSVVELAKAWGITTGSPTAIGVDKAKLALSIAGSSDSSALAKTLTIDGMLLLLVPASADARVLPSPTLITRSIKVQAFSTSKALQLATEVEVEKMTEELCEMISAGKFKANFVKHEFANVLECADDVMSASPGVHWLSIN
jgi:NADPH:quinone reductase-like Zn-dependent oxidoreductase